MKKTTIRLLAIVGVLLFSNTSSYSQNIDITPSVTQGCAPLPVIFTVTSAEPNAYRYDWYFGDSSPLFTDTLSSTVSHTYSDPNSYTSPTVYVYDANGNYITGVNPTPIDVEGNYIGYLPDSVCIGDSVNFSIGGISFNSVSWNFGDGNTSTQAYLYHAYNSLGVKQITATVNNSCGTYTLTKTIKVSANITPYPPYFWPDLYTTCPGVTIHFSTSNYPGYDYLWDFGDGDTSHTINSFHAFSNTGVQTVTLTVTNGCGISSSVVDTTSINITNTPPPFTTDPANFNITASPASGCQHTTINLYPPGGSFSEYHWDYGDGSAIDTLGYVSTYHTYNSLGTFTISLKIKGSCGNDTTIYKTVLISNNLTPPPFTTDPANFKLNASPQHACPGSEVYLDAPYGFLNYVWNYGDNSSLDTTGSYYGTNHTYNTTGTYNASVKITGFCNVDTTIYTTITINNNAPFPNQLYVAAPSPSCPNTPVSFQASYGFEAYEWSFGDGLSISNNNGYIYHAYDAVGSYNVSVKLTNGCGRDTTIYTTLVINSNVPFNNNMYLSYYTHPDPSCPNSQVNFDASSGFGTYQWSCGDNSPVITTTNYHFNHVYAAPGNYNTWVKIINGCGLDTTLYDTVHIVNNLSFYNPQNEQPFELHHSPLQACTSDKVHFDAPYGYNSYEWNFGDNTAITTSAYNNSSHKYAFNGVYYPSVKITNGCNNDTIIYDTVNITNNAGFSNGNGNFSLSTSTPVICPNSNVGFSAPNDYSSYHWYFGDGDSAVTTQGYFSHIYDNTITTYNVSVKIINGCGQDTTLHLTLQVNNNVGFDNNYFNVNATPNPACINDIVDFNAPSGYTSYKWKFSQTDSITSGQSYIHHAYNAPGTHPYSVKITNGCGQDTTLVGTVIIKTTGNTVYNDLSIYTTPNSGVSCPNDLIDFQFSKDGFYSYSWDFGDGDTATALGSNIQHSFSTPGTYNVTCKVLNGCGVQTTVYTSVQIISNAPISSGLGISSNPNPACPGDEVFFDVNSGQPSFKYIWNFGDGSPVDTTIGVGKNHIYTTPGTKTVTLTAINSCGSSKTITYTQIISTGTAPVLNNGGNRLWGAPSSFNNAPAGCANDAILFFFFGTAPNNVWDFGDGSPTTTATEQMQIDGGDGNMTVTIIKHVYPNNGNYNVRLTLTNGCGLSTTDSINIVIGSNIAVNGDLNTSPPPFNTCAPVDFIALGGASYSWNFGDGDTLTAPSPTVSHSYANPGVYVASVTVTNGCGSTANYSKVVNVSGNGGPAVAVNNITNPTCYNGNNGSATVSVTGGSAPYTYLWNDANHQTAPTATGLPAGVHEVEVTDNIGCTSTYSVVVNQTPQMLLSVTSTPSACSNSTGAATVNVTSGGTSPFTYLWSNNYGTSSLSNLSYGLYSVTVTDNNGCHSSANVNVSEVNAPVVTLDSVINVSCNGGNNGGVNISVSGSSSYTYLWSNGATTQDINNLAAGSYSLTVTSGSGCNAVFNATVASAAQLTTTAATFVAPTCAHFNGQAKATSVGGTAPYTYLWDANTNNQTTAIATGLPAGTYSVTVTDAKGCTAQTQISLSNSNAPNITANISQISCNGSIDGNIDVSVTGGTSPYLYTWNVPPPNSNSQDLDTLTSGLYILTVNDAQGCLAVRSYNITEPDSIATALVPTDASCSSSDGSITATVNGGTAPYTYSWTDGQNTQITQNATNLTTGTYTLTVTDNNGCVKTASATVATMATTPSICMVTVDTNSINNEIYWDKTLYTNVDSFIVYRETSTNIYKRIGGVPYDSLSMFIDTARSIGPANGDPNVGTYRYKIQLRDDCGNYSQLSPYHNTIYIVNNGGGIFTWNHYLVEAISLPPVANYVLTCDTSNTTPWFPITSVAGTQTTAADNDPTHLNHPDAVWRVRTDWSITCDPTRAPVNTTRSNKKQAVSVNGIATLSLSDIEMMVYPNPAKDNITIEFAPLKNGGQLKIVNTLSQIVYNEHLSNSSIKTTKQLTINNFAKGVYYIILETNSKNTLQKLVIE